MKVKKLIVIEKEEDLVIKKASLLSLFQTEACLSTEERKYGTGWCLRTPGCCSQYISFVDKYGDIRADGDYTFGQFAIRPCLYIDIKNSSFKVGDVFLFGGEEFRILAPNIAWIQNDIGKFPFRTDWRADDANVYKVSDAKKIVDEWFNNIIKKEEA